MFCTTIIPTIGRPKLARAVESVLGQAFSAESFELIVVNDSGKPLPAAKWQTHPQVTIFDINRRERCVARNVGAAAARGDYLHFLDDDDWMLPQAFETFYALAQGNSADLVYGGTKLVNRDNVPMFLLDHQLQGNVFTTIMAGEWIPLQSALIRSELFFKLGGFNYQALFSEDVDLVRRILLTGSVQGVGKQVSTVEMGEADSTTIHSAQVKNSRRAREKILSEEGVFQRLQTSAHSSFLQGRILRLYLTSMVQNAQSYDFLQFLDRGWHALRAVTSARHRLLSADYYRAIRHPYQSPTFENGKI